MHAEEVIETAEPPVNAIRKKKAVIDRHWNEYGKAERGRCVSSRLEVPELYLVGGQVIVGRIKGIRETAVSTAHSNRKRRFPADRLWGKR